MFFTSRQQVYKCRLSDFDDAKASVLGDYLPTKLGMEPEEAVVGMVLPGDYGGSMLFFFENGKAARVELSAYATTSNRRRLTGAYSDKSPLAALLHLTEDRELVLYSSDSRALIFSTALLAPKTTRSTQGCAGWFCHWGRRRRIAVRNRSVRTRPWCKNLCCIGWIRQYF